jgi:Ca2+-dependent lipid-binding protein
VANKTLSPQWECSREFSVADVSLCRFTVRLLDFDSLTADDALGDVDLELKELLEQEEAVSFNRRATKVNKHTSNPHIHIHETYVVRRNRQGR